VGVFHSVFPLFYKVGYEFSKFRGRKGNGRRKDCGKRKGERK